MNNEPIGLAFIGAGIVAEIYGRGVAAIPSATHWSEPLIRIVL